MCLATPVKVLKKINGKKHSVVVEDMGHEHTIDTSLLEEVKVGDWLLCHESLAINKLAAGQAKEILKLAKACPHQHAHGHAD